MNNNWRFNGFYNNTKLTGLFEAVQRRFSCRSFAAAPGTAEWATLQTAAADLALPGVRIALDRCENSLFQPMLGLLMKFENVQRYAAVIVTDAQPGSVVNAGISGEMFLLRAVELGLGGCWVSGTYKRAQVSIRCESNERIVALMPLGVPQTVPAMPIQRKRKDLYALCPDFDKMDSAMKEVAQYVQLAPSAMNMQPWRMQRSGEHTMTLAVGGGGQRLDLGIALCHALLALGSTPAQFSLDAPAQCATITLL